MNRLTYEDGLVTLNGSIVPGIFQNISIRGSVRFDDTEKDGLSGKQKSPIGWEDSAITMGVELLTDDISTCYEKLAELNDVFKEEDGSSNPVIYTISNPHMRARGLNQVVFSGLDSVETNRRNLIKATLNFIEYFPIVNVSEVRTAGKTSGTETSTPGINLGKREVSEPEASSTLYIGVE